MRRYIPAVFAAAFSAVIFAISGSPELKVALHTHGRLHPWVHILAFVAVSFTATLCSRRTWIRLFLLTGVLFLAWVTEYREHLVDGLPLEQFDVITDAIGIAIGSVLGWAASSFRTRAVFAE